LLAGDGRDRAVEWRAVLERVDSQIYTHPEGWEDQARRQAERAIPILERTGDKRALARAWTLLAKSHVMRPGYSSMEQALEAAIEHARLADDRRREAEVLWWLGWCLFYGPTPVSEGIPRCEDILGSGAGSRRVEETMLGTLA